MATKRGCEIFLADLRYREEDCSFCAFLDKAVRDVIVIGLQDERNQVKLFTDQRLILDAV